MTNEALHRLTVVTLARAAVSPMLDDEGLKLLCWHCGVDIDELHGVKVAGYRMDDLPRFVPKSTLAQGLMDQVVEEH